MRAVLVAVMMVVASTAHAESRVFRWSEYAVIGGHALDAASTQRCLGEGRCHELNRWLARFDDPVAFTGAKLAVGSVQLWAVRKLATNHPKLATTINVAMAVALTGIAIRNAQVGK